MARRKLFKFKLTKKQKRGIIVFVAMVLCSAGVFWLLARPITVKRTPTHRDQLIPARTTLVTQRSVKTVPRRFTSQPKVTFVIDDIGYHLRDRDRLTALSDKVTYAILPLLPYSRYFGNLSRTTGAEIILHLPLDTLQDKVPGRGLIVDTMTNEAILDMLARDLDSVPNHVGVNNHMGSRGTASREMMTIILKELKRRGLFFLDSYKRV